MRVIRSFTALLIGALWVPPIIAAPNVPFTQNNGQWHPNVLYRSIMSNSAVFVEANAMTYVLWSGLAHEHHGSQQAAIDPAKPRMHAYRVTFEGGASAMHEGRDRQPHYENYFIGSDPSHWAGNVPVFGEAYLHQLYSGIDLRVTGEYALKYDLIVAPDVDPSIVSMRYDGVDGMALKDGKLWVMTSAGTVVEQEPYAYQLINGEQHQVECHYVLNESRVRFALPDGYDRSRELVIDPILNFSTYSGSTANNFGSTATYDDSGHLYGGGTAFAIGYPTTVGVLDPTFNGSTTDIAISKFTPDGSSIVWSTYLGGSGNENPHSLVVNNNDELYILGNSGSSDYPTTIGAFDQSFGGGMAVNFTGGYGFIHDFGCDIVVSHLNANATQLIGSTYLGGTGNDGINDNSALVYNYGDPFRGEIALDLNEDPVIASMTHSPDAVVSSGAPQSTYSGSQDGYLVRMTPDLGTMTWGTYLGGSGSDAAYGVQFDSAGRLFVAGGTNSPDLPMSGSPFNGTAQGAVDGFVMRFEPSGTMSASTYIGTSSYDQCYFVQVDLNDDIYILGQTEGNYPISAGVFSEPNSGQFLHKFNNALSASLWSTTVGSGNGGVDISPTAFLVSDCGQIYISGWGSVIVGGSLSTTGLTVTGDAYQSTTDGHDLYLMLLAPDAANLVYATYFGGGVSTEHVDGGTSRFDKDGTVYQAVCAGCGGNDDFPSTAGVWSSTNGSDCNLGVFKFNISQILAQIGINGPQFVCLGDPASFQNLSTGGNGYLWSFGDGNTSTDFEPSHTYTSSGTYSVTMVLLDSSSCSLDDTTSIMVEVFDPLDANALPVDTICPGDPVQLTASGGTTYTWFPTTGLSDPSIATPIASPLVTTTYFVAVEDLCSVDTATVTVNVLQPSGGAGQGATICIGDAVPISATGGGSYLWSPGASLDNATLAAPMASPMSTTTYTVVITTPGGCTITDSILVNVQLQPPTALNNDTSVCPGGAVQLLAFGGDTYQWQPAAGITVLNIPNPTVTPPQSITYVVDIGNTCGNVLDSVLVEVIEVLADAWPDTSICPGVDVTLYASGGIDYLWSPSSSLSVADSSVTVASTSSPTEYRVRVIDANGCVDSASLFIDHFPVPQIYAGEDVITQFWEPVQLFALGDPGFIHWSPGIELDCDTCYNPVASPENTTLFTVTLTDSNTCKAVDEVLVLIEGSLFVPNAFTPDGDGFNDAFYATTREAQEFEMLIFNRWGELIFTSDDPYKPWDGTYNGVASPIDTYVWKVQMTEVTGKKRRAIGHVSLVR